jgi:hypothetical protein
MNCLSRHVLLRAVTSVGVALVLVLTASGAYAGVGAFGPNGKVNLPAAEPAIAFTGSVIAPLVCTSTPDTGAVTISEDTRITLANFTGADASVDTGTEHAVIIGNGVGLSVRFRPGRYTVRMVPSCTVTSTVRAAVVTVVDATAAQPIPGVSPPPLITLPPPSGGTGTVAPDPTRTGGTTTAPPPPPSPANTVSSGAPSRRPPEVGGGGTGPAPTEPFGTPATGAGADPVLEVVGQEPVIYDTLLVPVQQQGDPRDVRLLAVISVICVFGVTAAIIRAIVSQRARGTVST